MSIDPNMAINVRVKVLELSPGLPLEEIKARYDWVMEPSKTPAIIPVTKEVKIING